MKLTAETLIHSPLEQVWRRSQTPDLHVRWADWSGGPCFASREEARDFLKYRPRGLAADHTRLRLAEVFRDEAKWRETPLHVEHASWSLPESFAPCALELATRVDPIEYRWRLGRRVNLGRD